MRNAGDKLQVNTKEANEIKLCTPENVFPEYFIIRVNEFNDIATTPLEEWVDYLKNNRIREDTTAPGLREASQRLLYMTMNDKERRAYDAHMDDIMVQNDVLDTAKTEGREEGLAEGRAEGRAEGIESERIATIKRLKALGIDNGTIAAATGLTVDEVMKHLQ